MLRPSWKGAGHAFPRSPQENGPCPVCRDLQYSSDEANVPNFLNLLPTDLRLRQYKTGRHRMDIYDLAESADAGDCFWCSLVHRALIEVGAEMPAPGGVATVRLVVETQKPLYVEWTTSEQRFVAEIFQPAGSQHDIPALGQALDIEPDLASDAVFDMIRAWVEECDNSHAECKAIPTPTEAIPTPSQPEQRPKAKSTRFRKSIEKHFRKDFRKDSINDVTSKQRTSLAPRRFLDVGDPLDQSGLLTIRLVQDLNDHVRYMALSHCWGGRQTCITTKKTLDARLQDIAWEHLPKTYQDSVIVARKLRLRYIWIDSLCIIQDDPVDWSTEAVKMGEIYEHAYVTLAAALSPADDVGFLDTPSERNMYKSFQVDLRDFGRGDQVRVRKVHDYRTVRTPHCLDDRSWTFQEALLPPRLLTFSVTVFYECRKSDACECGSGLFPDPFSGERRSFARPDRSAYASFLRNELDTFDRYVYWRQTIVEQYTKRNLTRANDRLPALHALTSNFANLANDESLAGLWRDDLVLQLSWYTAKYHEPVPRRAPSWSWASIEGPVNFANPGSIDWIPGPKMQLLKSQVDIAPNGELRQGKLRIEALMCWAQVYLQWNADHEKYAMRMLREPTSSDKVKRAPAQGGIWMDTALCPLPRYTNDGSTFLHIERTTTERNEDIMFRARFVLLGEFVYNKYRWRSFLILTQDARKERVFHRVGLFVITRKPNDHFESEWFTAMGKREITLV